MVVRCGDASRASGQRAPAQESGQRVGQGGGQAAVVGWVRSRHASLPPCHRSPAPTSPPPFPSPHLTATALRPHPTATVPLPPPHCYRSLAVPPPASAVLYYIKDRYLRWVGQQLPGTSYSMLKLTLLLGMWPRGTALSSPRPGVPHRMAPRVATALQLEV